MSNPTKLLRHLVSAAAAVVCVLSGAVAHAQTYPVRPINLVVPFAPGGTTDIIARAVGHELAKSMGQPVIVDNRPGAGGNIGAQFVARAAADGYTLLMGTVGTHGINLAVYPRLPYDPVKDFAPVSLVAAVPNVVALNRAFSEKNNITDIRSLITYLKKNPGKMNMASSGNGTSIHLAGEMFQTLTKTSMVHIPYRGSSQSLTDVIGGQADIVFDNLPSAIGFIRQGKLLAIAVTSSKPSPALPGVPTVAQSGGELTTGYEASSWFGVLAPAGTPKAIVEKLQQEISKALSDPAVQEKLVTQGAEPIGNRPDQFAAHIQAEIRKWAKVAKDSGAKVD